MDTINLSGTWAFSLDRESVGIDQQWYAAELSDFVTLPGSLDENGVGDLVTEQDIHQFNRRRSYVGVAWYQKEIVIDEDDEETVFSLFLERCLWETKVWVDGHYVGEGESLCVPHQFDLSGLLTPGRHRMTIRVDNSRKYHIGHRSHAYSEDQQTIWNGIVGRIELQRHERLFIKQVKTYPDAASQQVRFQVTYDNRTGAVQPCTLLIRCGLKTDEVQQTPQIFAASAEISVGASNQEFTVRMDDAIQLWDELSPALYLADLELSSTGAEARVWDAKTQAFGFRDFTADGRVFRINGRKILLRGTHDAGCFPLTGYPSTLVEDWQRIFKTVKEYGLNHVRFHSYNPPEAAFEAADVEGIILQTELPLFSISAPPIGEDTERDDFLRRELDRILETLGNHPSFCMMAMGNELFGDYDILNRWVDEAKVLDARHLYTTVSNNGLNSGPDGRPTPSDEFFVTHNYLADGERMLRRCEDVFNRSPETLGDYRVTLEDIEVPTVSHEVGQWQMYPNFSEIEKITGVLRASNYEVFRDSLTANGLLDQADAFFQASGKFVAILYREEIERSLRTPDYGGFQLLDLHDYHGQGTSTIGVLDSFWESKGIIAPEAFRRSCAARVLLARLPKRVFAAGETATVVFEIANYSGQVLDDFSAEWAIRTGEGTELCGGQLPAVPVVDGSLTTLCEIELMLPCIDQPQKMQLELSHPASTLMNSWELWVYPEVEVEVESASDYLLVEEWSDAVEEALDRGQTVILQAKHAVGSEGMRFTPPFWNTLLFSGQPKSMGILCDPQHPLFKHFPTEFHANWQWFDLLTESRAVDLTAGFDAITPILQCIDHPVRNAKMSFLFEARVGQGRLLCCGLNLSQPDSPVTRQFKHSLNDYIQGADFNPQVELDVASLRGVLQSAPANWLSTHVKRIEANSQWWDSPVGNCIDGESSTYWKSGRGQPYPHDIIIELDETRVIWGARYTPRQDGLSAGWVKDYEVYISEEPSDWGEPTMSGRFADSADSQRMVPKLTDDGFNVTHSKRGCFVKFRILSSHDGGTADTGRMLGSVAEFDLMIEQFRLDRF